MRAVAFSPNGEIVTSVALDKTIRFWNVKQGKEVHVIKVKDRTNIPVGLIFSTDGDRIAFVYSYSPGRVEIRSVELK